MSDVLDLFRDLSQLQGGFFDPTRAPRGFVAAVDLWENGEAYHMHMDLPGVSGSSLDIHIENNVLTVKGARAMPELPKGDRIGRMERGHGAFQRTFALPKDVDGEKIEAELREGVLLMRIPKREEAKPRSITVRVSTPTDQVIDQGKVQAA